MLASVLDGGSSARFSRELVRGQRVAASAGADYSAFTRLPGLFTLAGVPASGHSIEELEQALLQQIERVRTELVAPEELKRIRTQLIAAKVYEQDSVFYQAMQLGQLETVGLGWPLMDEYVQHLSAVTPEQVRAVAAKYLVPEVRTVARLDPQPLGQADTPKTAALTAGAQGHVR
jgi:zinc protease